MKHSYTVSLSVSGLDTLIRAVDDYKKWLESRAVEFANKLALLGEESARSTFAMAHYDGINDTQVHIEQRGEMTWAVVAEGQAVLFIEFGSGMYLGSGHPEPQGYGPGTFPGKGHWNDPNGWYLPKSVQTATGIKHSIGNAPAMAMYNSVKEIEANLERIAREVFS